MALTNLLTGAMVRVSKVYSYTVRVRIRVVRVRVRVRVRVKVEPPWDS